MSQYAVLFDDADEPCFMYINTRNFYFFGLLVILHIKTKTHRNIFLLPSWDLQNCERIFDSELAMKAIVGSRSGNWEMLPSVPNVGWWPTSRSERFTPTPPFRQTATISNNLGSECVSLWTFGKWKTSFLCKDLYSSSWPNPNALDETGKLIKFDIIHFPCNRAIYICYLTF
jgi:hypothetical protein